MKNRQADHVQAATLAIATVCVALVLGIVVSNLQTLEPSYVQLLHRLFY